MPTTPFRGVRISWLMVARNDALALDASRAASREATSSLVRSATRSSKCSLASCNAAACCFNSARLLVSSSALPRSALASVCTSVRRALFCNSGTSPLPSCCVASAKLRKLRVKRYASQIARTAARAMANATIAIVFSMAFLVCAVKSLSGTATTRRQRKPSISPNGCAVTMSVSSPKAMRRKEAVSAPDWENADVLATNAA